MDTTTQTVSQSQQPKAEMTERIGFWEKIWYGGGDLASNLILVLTSTYVAFFYTEALGLNAAIVGAIIMVSRLFDGISDIAMGFVMDRTKSKHGKARPWMLWLAVPIAIATVLVFVVPNVGDLGRYIYVFISYNLVTTILYTAINIPYGALTARMSRDQNQRMIINMFRMFLAQIGSLAINALTIPFVRAIGGGGENATKNQYAWVIVACIYAVAAAALFLMCFYKTKERVEVPSEKIKFFKSLRLCFRNDQWLLLVAVWVIMAVGMGMGMSAGTYYAKYWLHDEAMMGYLSAIGTLVALVAMPIMTGFIKKYGKRNVAIFGGVVGLIGQALFLVNPLSFQWLAFCTVVKGVGMATGMGTMFAMIADTIEYGQWKNGTRVEGMLYSTTTFGAKIGAGVAVAIAMAVLGAAGYDGLLTTQPPAAMDAIRSIYLFVPIPFQAVLPVIYIFYNLDKIYPKVMKDLAEGKSKKDSQE